MRVAALWRYPVKSMQGESPDEVELGVNGVAGDRSFGVLDLDSGSVLSAKREGRLLEATARLAGASVLVGLPGAREIGPGAELDEHLSQWLGRRSRLVDAAGHPSATFEAPADFERDDSELVSWTGPSGSFADSSPVHLLTLTDLAQLARERPELQWDVRRFRPNVVVDDAGGALPIGRDGLATASRGDRIALGAAQVEVEKPCSRCVMTTRVQPGGLERQLDVLRHVIAAHETNIGLLAEVVRGGTVRVGDEVKVLG
jgi:uncharacterized protein YcbX